MDNIVARFSLDHMRYIAQEPAHYVKNSRENLRAPHLYVICFQYDGDKFHSDIRMGRLNVSQRVH